MVWVRKTNSPTKQTCPSPPTNIPCKRAEPQEPTWRRVLAKSMLQKVEPQEPAQMDKGNYKMVDVTNVPPSSTSMSFLPITQVAIKVTRPMVVTQELS